MIARAIRRRFGPHARRVRVQSTWHAHLFWVGLALAAAATAFFGWVGYTHWDRWAISFGTRSELESLRAEHAALGKENAGLRSELAIVERQRQIERASHAELAKQVKAMADENARLREDAALMQAVAAPEAKIDGVKVSTARVEPGAVAGEYNYRIVLLQTGARRKSFQGSYQLVVNLSQDGARRTLTIPAPAEQGASGYKVDFRVSQRVEGSFRVDSGTVVRSVQVRVFESGQSQPRATQTVTLS